MAKNKNLELTATGGSGLGLFIARKIVEVHGGRICLPASGGGGVRRRRQGQYVYLYFAD